MCGTYARGFAYQNHINSDGESRQQTHFFHCDQIGIPREMTDKDGNLLWFGNYTGWGRLKKDERVYKDAHTNPSACKTSTPIVKRGCITTSSGIMSLMRVGLSIRTRLGFQAETICISSRNTISYESLASWF